MFDDSVRTFNDCTELVGGFLGDAIKFLSASDRLKLFQQEHEIVVGALQSLQESTTCQDDAATKGRVQILTELLRDLINSEKAFEKEQKEHVARFLPGTGHYEQLKDQKAYEKLYRKYASFLKSFQIVQGELTFSRVSHSKQEIKELKTIIANQGKELKELKTIVTAQLGSSILKSNQDITEVKTMITGAGGAAFLPGSKQEIKELKSIVTNQLGSSILQSNQEIKEMMNQQITSLILFAMVLCASLLIHVKCLKRGSGAGREVELMPDNFIRQ